MNKFIKYRIEKKKVTDLIQDIRVYRAREEELKSKIETIISRRSALESLGLGDEHRLRIEKELDYMADVEAIVQTNRTLAEKELNKLIKKI
jgi:hypothetical protein